MCKTYIRFGICKHLYLIPVNGTVDRDHVRPALKGVSFQGIECPCDRLINLSIRVHALQKLCFPCEYVAAVVRFDLMLIDGTLAAENSGFRSRQLMLSRWANLSVCLGDPIVEGGDEPADDDHGIAEPVTWSKKYYLSVPRKGKQLRVSFDNEIQFIPNEAVVADEETDQDQLENTVETYSEHVERLIASRQQLTKLQLGDLIPEHRDRLCYALQFWKYNQRTQQRCRAFARESMFIVQHSAFEPIKETLAPRLARLDTAGRLLPFEFAQLRLD